MLSLYFPNYLTVCKYRRARRKGTYHYLKPSCWGIPLKGINYISQGSLIASNLLHMRSNECGETQMVWCDRELCTLFIAYPFSALIIPCRISKDYISNVNFPLNTSAYTTHSEKTRPKQ